MAVLGLFEGTERQSHVRSSLFSSTTSSGTGISIASDLYPLAPRVSSMVSHTALWYFCAALVNTPRLCCRHVSPALIQIEAEIIADATTRGIWEEGGEMAVRASATSRQASLRSGPRVVMG